MAVQALVGAVQAGKKVAEGKDKKKKDLLGGIKKRAAERTGGTREERKEGRKERMEGVQEAWDDSNTPITDKYTKGL